MSCEGLGQAEGSEEGLGGSRGTAEIGQGTSTAGGELEDYREDCRVQGEG